MALRALSIHLYPGEQNPRSKQRKAQSIELMNSLQEQDHRQLKKDHSGSCPQLPLSGYLWDRLETLFQPRKGSTPRSTGQILLPTVRCFCMMCEYFIFFKEYLLKMFEIVGLKKIRISKNEATFQVCIHQQNFVGTLPRLCLCTVYSSF